MAVDQPHESFVFPEEVLPRGNGEWSQCEPLSRGFVWGVCFSLSLLINGGMPLSPLMWSNVRDINKMMDEPRKPRHPETPQKGDELLYVDLSREKLENLYKGD